MKAKALPKQNNTPRVSIRAVKDKKMNKIAGRRTIKMLATSLLSIVCFVSFSFASQTHRSVDIKTKNGQTIKVSKVDFTGQDNCIFPVFSRGDVLAG
jgi:hypothetical protein